MILADAVDALLRPGAWWRPREEPERTILTLLALALASAVGITGLSLLALAWAVETVRLTSAYVRERRELRQLMVQPLLDRSWQTKRERR